MSGKSLFALLVALLSVVLIANSLYIVKETERAVNELGMFGPYIGPDFPGSLCDPQMDRFYEALVALNVPLFIHPAPAGIDGPCRRCVPG